MKSKYCHSSKLRRACSSLIDINLAVVEDLLNKVFPVVLGGLDEGSGAVSIESPVRVNVIVAQE